MYKVKTDLNVATNNATKTTIQHYSYMVIINIKLKTSTELKTITKHINCRHNFFLYKTVFTIRELKLVPTEEQNNFITGIK